jgi:hypothetical protein
MSKKLSLDKCTKKSCNRCDLGYIIKDYVKPLMQALTIDIPDYYMRLLTSKCLNTSVLIAFFMAGKDKALMMANYCDTRATAKRHQEGTDNNKTIVEKLTKDVLYKRVEYRYLYYILMTDATLPMDDPNEKGKFFCGHVFIIEKIPGNTPYYYFYQSYINEYDFKGYIKKHNNTLKKTYQEMEVMLNKIKYILLNKYWDSNSVKYWKDITYVDTTQLLNSKPSNNIFLCFKKIKLKQCVENISKYVKSKLEQISLLNYDSMNKTYGDPSLFDKDQNALSAKEIQSSFINLQNHINYNKYQLE